MRRCHPSWRCLQFGCPRCDRERQQENGRRDLIRGISDYCEVPTIGSRRAQRDAERKAANAERERRENDPNLN